MPRITPEMTSATELVSALASYEDGGGNPGAVHVGMALLHAGMRRDHFVLLDELGVYADRLWGLYKDVCRENIFAVGMLCEAYAHNAITKGEIDNAIDNGDALNLVEIALKTVHLQQAEQLDAEYAAADAAAEATDKETP